MAETAGLVALSVLWTFGEVHPVGASLGGSLERELADPSRSARPIEVVGVIGVDARFELRSLRTPWLLVGGLVGVAKPTIASQGWTPVWEAMLESGLAVSPTDAGMHVGVRLVKDLSPCFVDCTGGAGLSVRATLGTEVVGGLSALHATQPTAAAGLAVRVTPLFYNL